MSLTIALFGSPLFCDPIISTLHQFKSNIYYFKLNKDRDKKIKDQPMKTFYFDSIQNKTISDELKMIQPDYIFVANFSQKIPQTVIKLAQKEALNFHPSILPQYKGPDPFFWVLKNGEELSGITVHKLNEKWDSGDILLAHKFQIELIDTYTTLVYKTANEMSDLIKKLHPILQKESPVFTTQNQGSYFGNIQPNDYIIKWEQPAKDVYNHMRSLPVNTPAITKINSKIVNLIESELTTMPAPFPGKLLVKDNNIYIGANDFYLKINVLMREFQIYSSSTFLKLGNIS